MMLVPSFAEGSPTTPTKLLYIIKIKLILCCEPTKS